MSHPALHGGPSNHGDEIDDPIADDHFAPEGWEEVDRGICTCGEVVRWDYQLEQWVPDRTLKVLILAPDEAELVAQAVAGLSAGDETADVQNFDLQQMVRHQIRLNEPWIEDEQDYANPFAADFDPKAAQDAGH